MRFTWIVAVTISLAAPAAAQEPTLFEQYVDASELFLGNAQSPGDYQEGQPAKLLDNLAGDWFPIGVLLPASDDTAMFKDICTKIFNRIVVRDAYSFDFTLRPGEDDEVTTTYSSRGGNAFGSYTDPAAWLHRLGLDGAGANAATINTALSNINGVATLHRPSPDMLVIQTNFGSPQIFARCP